MRIGFRLARILSTAAVIGVCALASVSAARAQGSVDDDARRVLSSLSSYLGGLQRFSVEYAAVDEVITEQGQKLQFLHSGSLTAQRPDRLHAVRRGASGTSEVFLNGRELFLFGRDAQAYLQLPATGIAAAIDAVHGLGFDAPGADLLVARPFDSAIIDVTSGTHVGMTVIDGVEVHHLAFRGAEVDWQIWVTTGDRPLPVRYVITSKTVAGAPQYTLQLRNWNVAPQVDAGQFNFVPPQGARRLDPASVTVNAIGDMIIRTQ
ncbi:DUF2092 domain-containing protein [Roseomonas rosulenta]|uniref:DUF2092 domain-containing protein n=1 Tax=Roseomonas rosulenta TaxID=2748667 RepID=UPI0018DF3115|nr:DUF2092 domain-containing protein [Roseomonas rosulenta]